MEKLQDYIHIRNPKNWNSIAGENFWTLMDPDDNPLETEIEAR
ncbi:11367_t:CDS:2 [Funneliformis geosporum]|nr:11367_t:CDS:2 [Funneliformis geosporum]